MCKDVRVRFAPSPTGYLHVGGARTALFNYLFARHNDGSFILRIEDTDRERSDIELVNAILDGLNWLGLEYDEGPVVGGNYGPYFQSERKGIYSKYIEILKEKGSLYPCFCTPEELAKRREECQKRGKPYRYDRRCRQLSKVEIERRMREGIPYALRILTPDDGETAFDDMIRGRVSFKNSELDDPIVVRSDGSHVPLILGPDRKRLSKRHGATSISAYRDDGYLPCAMFNFLSLLGWSAGEDREIMSKDEIIERFTIEGISRSPAIFDVDKLKWMNGHYIREMDENEFVVLAERQLINNGVDLDSWKEREGEQWVKRVILIEKEKMKRMTDIFYLTEFFFNDELEYEARGVKKHLSKPESKLMLLKVLDGLEGLDERAFYPADEGGALDILEDVIRGVAESEGVSAGKVIHPVRVAISGRTSGPGLFEMMYLLGKKRCVERINVALDRFFT
ncbi:MAG: hypothetical protein B6D57_00855 [Candidatus Coatesbacteria bacterium 4484_99]|uniref:Glutamate--tRNA ligase n=1 Tax=Candidatus Coatesbacteria bacterium 4484_99 TaxID=1970774 RepID=A0A1W9S2P8_9BACT|nr:MAG: hypothetical protein B6D57_00855 [Candidatus Coatesbacteria bacterium 4484_99]